MTGRAASFDFSPFVGLPWEDRGRGPSYDCWGLFRHVFTIGTGIELPSHADDYLTSADRAETARVLAGGLDEWVAIDAGRERTFDGAVMKIAGGIHIGLVVRRGYVLHMPRTKTSVIEPLSRYRDGLTGLYRHRGLA